MSFSHERLDVYRAALEYGRRGYAIRDESERYAAAPGVDADTDSDSEEPERMAEPRFAAPAQ